MKALLGALAFFALGGIAQADGPPAPPAGKTWDMVYSDDFSGNKIDPQAWSVQGDIPRAGGWWMRDNAKLDGQGNLVLSTTPRQGKLATGAIRGKQSWRFGYFEMRCKIPRTPAGHRPAFWLQTPGTFSKTGDGRDGTEIDIFEAWSRDGQVQINLHWNVDRKGPGRTSQGFKPPRAVTYNQWHTFAVWWTPESYRFYIDGDEVWETTAGGVSQVPQAIQITDEALEGDRLRVLNVAAARRSDPFLIDYVRVYQLRGE